MNVQYVRTLCFPSIMSLTVLWKGSNLKQGMLCQNGARTQLSRRGLVDVKLCKACDMAGTMIITQVPFKFLSFTCFSNKNKRLT